MNVGNETLPKKELIKVVGFDQEIEVSLYSLWKGEKSYFAYVFKSKEEKVDGGGASEEARGGTAGASKGREREEGDCVDGGVGVHGASQAQRGAGEEEEEEEEVDLRLVYSYAICDVVWTWT